MAVRRMSEPGKERKERANGWLIPPMIRIIQHRIRKIN